jgi:hypothetical protein
MTFRKHKDLRLEDETYGRVLITLQNSLFLEKKGLANDLPFFICPYDPATEVRARTLGQMFAKELEKKGISTLGLNLYDILISVLKADGYLDMLLEREGTIEREEFLETIQNLTSPVEKIVPEIETLLTTSPPQILFLTGIGEVFPFLRPHSILSHLQAQLSDQLTVMFFPGDYSYTETKGATLDIFGLKQEERYYRAFNIFEYEV